MWIFSLIQSLLWEVHVRGLICCCSSSRAKIPRRLKNALSGSSCLAPAQQKSGSSNLHVRITFSYFRVQTHVLHILHPVNKYSADLSSASARYEEGCLSPREWLEDWESECRIRKQLNCVPTEREKEASAL
jgi:hypothetical protein